MGQITETVDFQYHQELGGLEMVNAQYFKKNFSKHCHETYTVSVIRTGVQKFFRSGGEHFAPEHSIILVNADDVHTGQAADGVGWAYQAIYPTEQQFQQLAAAVGWSAQFAPYFPSPVVYDPELSQELRQLFHCLMHESSSLLRESQVNAVLLKLMMRHSVSRKTPAAVNYRMSAVHRARDYMHQHLMENVSLNHLAAISHTSVYHFTRQFSKAFGLSPHAYQLQLKLKKSKELLKQGYSVVSTSNALGFHDQSHFHRHFKKAMGVAPGQFAAAVN